MIYLFIIYFLLWLHLQIKKANKLLLFFLRKKKKVDSRKPAADLRHWYLWCFYKHSTLMSFPPLIAQMDFPIWKVSGSLSAERDTLRLWRHQPWSRQPTSCWRVIPARVDFGSLSRGHDGIPVRSSLHTKAGGCFDDFNRSPGKAESGIGVNGGTQSGRSSSSVCLLRWAPKGGEQKCIFCPNSAA